MVIIMRQKKHLSVKLLAAFLCLSVLGGATASLTGCTKTPQTGSDTDAATEIDTEISAETDPAPAETDPAPAETDPAPDTVPETQSNPESETAMDTETMPETEALLTRDEAVDLLAGSMYTNPIRTDAFLGLSDPSNVGIKEVEMGQVKYPIPADADCAHVYLVTDHGITADGTENAARFNALMQELASVEGVKKVVFPAGVYPFEDTLRISGVNDIYICAEEGGLFEISMTEWKQGISVSNCRNIHFNNFAFDYATPTAVTGVVVSADTQGGTVVIKVDEGYDLTDPRYNGGKVTWGSYMEFKLDRDSGKYIPNDKGNLLYNSTGDQVKRISDGSYDPETRELTLTFSQTLAQVKAGTRVNVAYTMYEYFGMNAQGCENIYLENANFYHTAGMTFGAGNTKNIYLNRFRLSPREGSERLMTATADGLHFGNCTGEVILTNSVLEYSHDDCLNIKGSYAAVTGSDEHTVFYDRSSTNIGVEVGDIIDVYETNTFRFVGSYTVTAVDAAFGKYTVAETVSEDLSSGFMVCNATKSPKFTAHNCFFGNKRNRGMLIQCRGVEISNCTFQNIVHGAIQILSVADIFAEGIMPRDVVVKNNKFLGNSIEDVHIFTWGRGGTTPGTIRNVTVENNFISGTGRYPVDILGGGEITVANNLFSDIRGVKNSVIIRTSTDITVKDNLSLPARTGGYKTVDADGTAQNIVTEGNYIKDELED